MPVKHPISFISSLTLGLEHSSHQLVGNVMPAHTLGLAEIQLITIYLIKTRVS